MQAGLSKSTDPLCSQQLWMCRQPNANSSPSWLPLNPRVCVPAHSVSWGARGMLFAQLWARWAPAAWLTPSVCTSDAAPSSRHGWSITAAFPHPSAWAEAFLSHTDSLNPPICQRDAFPQSLPTDIQQRVLIFPSIEMEVLCSGVPGHSLTPQELGGKKIAVPSFWK